ncbi:MAG: DPP IV N-terminal domain-containing protein, partial [bacterium]
MSTDFLIRRAASAVVCLASLASLSVLSIATVAHAQTYTPLKDLPGGPLVARMRSALSGIGEGGTVGDVRWNLAAGELWFEAEGWKTLDLATGEVKAADPNGGGGEPPASLNSSLNASRGTREGRERRPPRGRQFTREESPDGAWTAVSENGNLFLQPSGSNASGSNASGERVQVTKDGTADLKYGQASWVYGEELDQTTAMWWSPDSKFIAFYRFDESKVGDFYFLSGWTETKTRIESEAYPKPGEPNPTAEILVHELATGKTVVIDRFSASDAAQAAADERVEYYLYNVRWTPDGSELLYSRTPRRQDVLDVLAADPRTGASRLVVQERQDTWQ